MSAIAFAFCANELVTLISGIDFTNILREAFKRADFKMQNESLVINIFLSFWDLRE